MLRPSAHPGGGGAGGRYGQDGYGHAEDADRMLTRKTTMKFQYNNRAAFALIPPLAAVISAGGAPALACTAIGAIVAYILDVSCMGDGALIAVWLTLLADYLCLAFGGNIFNDKTSMWLSLMLSFACGQTLFLVGTWASLQVRCVRAKRGGFHLPADGKQNSRGAEGLSTRASPRVRAS